MLLPSIARALDQLSDTDSVPAGYGVPVANAIRQTIAALNDRLDVATAAAAEATRTIQALSAENDRLHKLIAN